MQDKTIYIFGHLEICMCLVLNLNFLDLKFQAPFPSFLSLYQMICVDGVMNHDRIFS